MLSPDAEYLDLLREVMTYGEERIYRNGVRRSLFGRRMQFNLGDSFPLLTTKRIYWRGVVGELLWMLRGETNVRPLQEIGVHIWDEWADENGDLGPVYGAQWRRWPDGRGGTVDQISRLVDGLKDDPYSTRHILSAWNVAQIEDMALPPCHTLAQWYVTEDGRLDCQLYQRSADLFLGVPFNVASYALLTNMLAYATGRRPGIFTHVFGDVHLYGDHMDAAMRQMSRHPMAAPELHLLGPGETLDGWSASDIKLTGYRSHAAIEAPVSR